MAGRGVRTVRNYQPKVLSGPEQAAYGNVTVRTSGTEQARHVNIDGNIFGKSLSGILLPPSVVNTIFCQNCFSF